ncbi:MAG: cytochrome b5 domain-containing protein [Aquiluna sp.]|jgi:cytochrome b involved in lipid metabolism
MKDFFLNIGELPLHPLAVHFAVALFPVALLALIAVISVKKLRDKYLTLSVVAVILTLPLVFVAQQSGESLSEVLYEPQPHSEYGEMLMPLASVTAAAAAALWLSLRQNWKKIISQLLGVVAISLSVASIAMTFVVGHSGAEAVWGGRVPTGQEQNDSMPSGENSSSIEAAQGLMIPSSEIVKHNAPSDCWTVIETTVYDLSSYAQDHPGGAANITALCGNDATSAFTGQHGFTGVPAKVLSAMAIGTLEGTSTLPSTDVVYGEGRDDD